MVKVLFRVDASTRIGTGHVMRCLTLAQALRAQGAACAFAGREHAGHLLDLMKLNGFATYRFPVSDRETSSGLNWGGAGVDYAAWLGVDNERDVNDCWSVIRQSRPDWLVVDHYALDARWETALKPDVRKIMVIDDLANRSHDCDLLLDQNLGREERDYIERVPEVCKLFIGPEYALLRPEFAALRESSLARRRKASPLAHILVTMGGVDVGNVTGIVLDALAKTDLHEGCRISVVLGAKAPWLREVKERAEAMPYSTIVLSGISDMAGVMADADLAVGAAGSTSWERCCLGLPSIIVALADNQKPVAEALDLAGAASSLALEVVEAELPVHIARFRRYPETLKVMSEAAAKATMGDGATRIARQFQ